MKMITTMALLGALTLGFAEDVSEIDSQIEAMDKASAQERVQLMNEFKERLSKMNEDDRSEAINKLQAKVRTRTQVREEDSSKEDALMTMKQTRTRAQEIQTQNNKEMIQSQNMNQNQVGNQYIKTNVTGAGAPTMNDKMRGAR